MRRYREVGGVLGNEWQQATNARQRVIAMGQREGETEEVHKARIAGLVADVLLD